MLGCRGCAPYSCTRRISRARRSKSGEVNIPWASRELLWRQRERRARRDAPWRAGASDGAERDPILAHPRPRKRRIRILRGGSKRKFHSCAVPHAAGTARRPTSTISCRIPSCRLSPTPICGSRVPIWRGWLYTVMRNRFLAGVTKSNRSAAALQQIAADQPRPATGSSELRLILRDLYAALRRLPSNQRSAVLLIGVEGKSYYEAAQSMGTSVGACARTWRRNATASERSARHRDAPALHPAPYRPPRPPPCRQRRARIERGRLRRAGRRWMPSVTALGRAGLRQSRCARRMAGAQMARAAACRSRSLCRRRKCRRQPSQ